MFQALKYVPSTIGGINGELIVIGVLGLFGAAVLLLPFLDRNTERSRRVIRWVGLVSLLVMAVLTALAYFGGETAHQ
jgi:drug/metabolite transporter (DMT)-like permease